MCKHKTWDEFLAYPTVKIVKVKDRYLGGIRYAMMLAIFAYIIGYVIVYDQGYNECIVPDGSIELSLQKPPGMVYPSNYSYCLQNPNPNISDPLPCVVVDESDVYQPVDQTNAMYIISRYSQTHQTHNPNCTLDANGMPGPCSQPWIPMNESDDLNKSYAVGIETFTIRFRCFFQAREFFMETRNDYYSQSCAEMKGKLENYNGDKIASYGANGSDIISLQTILNAAGVDLNELQDYPPDHEQKESNRHAGVVLFFGIDFDGVYKQDVEYTYSVTQVPKVEYKVTLSTYVGSNERLITDTHGVKIFFVFSGSICRFDFQTMLIQMVAGLGLLSVATLTTDFLMQYIMPLRSAYVRYKYKETEHHDILRKKFTRRQLDTLEISQDTENTSVHNNGKRENRLSANKSDEYARLDD
eukprot:CAMPEP_0201571248 /NCGR_PEP_ID=MMETSP0190_2-20130828/13926_1 /ASSEMBLY_ACC=CAM_ASM_000263 /TAXON_ID=37353 /ORGANISM="Rosalina sp." /LENGTH=412 /DNA_ID=CAMNT_0047995683 /DNA_START=71 /DNA_END=1309 /DNA_ORIENTATION=-